MIDLENIFIGKVIELRWKETEIPLERVCNFFKLDEGKVLDMLQQKSIDVDCLLKWSKLLEYDFFRLYSQHLIFFSPPSSSASKKYTLSLPLFRKNLYTHEVIVFIMEQLKNGEKTKGQIIEDYKIPKTTLYKWISKYKDKI